MSQVFSPAPPAKLDVKWSNSQLVQPGDTVPVTVMTSRPSNLRWTSERGALYTLMLLDAGISRLLPKMYVHWMVTNIPGSNVQYGTEVMQYVTPFSLEFNDAGEFITDTANSSHPLIMAVFKQETGKIVVDETQAGCTKVSDMDQCCDDRCVAGHRRAEDCGLQRPADQVQPQSGGRQLPVHAVQRPGHTRHGLQDQQVHGAGLALPNPRHQRPGGVPAQD